MKLCFFMQRRFALIAHSLACSIYHKHPTAKFCGFVQTRRSFDFLNQQKEISYTQLVLEEDVLRNYKDEIIDWAFLKQLEKDYGIPYLWPHIEVDRIIRHGQHVRQYPHDTPKYSHEEMLQILQRTAKAVLKFLDEEKPDVLIFSIVCSLSSYLLYSIAKKRNIPIQIITLTRIGTKHSITDDYKTLSDVDEFFEKIKNRGMDFPKEREEAEKFLQRFRKSPFPYTLGESPNTRAINRKRQFSFLLPRNFWRSIQWLFVSTYQYLAGAERGDYSTITPWHFFIDKIRQKVRVFIGFDDLYDTLTLDQNFVFYPLQLEPENSTALFAPFYTDQLWLARQIAKSLPIDYVLCVKEHPTMYGKRSRRYYKELKKIPNVRLLSPTVVSYDLIARAKLIITISSSVGWEALLFKKPVITFGDVPYNKLSMARKCIAPEFLAETIKEHLATFIHNERELTDYLTAVFKASVDVDLVQIWDIEGGSTLKKRAHELEPLADLIAQKAYL